MTAIPWRVSRLGKKGKKILDVLALTVAYLALGFVTWIILFFVGLFTILVSTVDGIRRVLREE
jgi:hypothetical protein